MTTPTSLPGVDGKTMRSCAGGHPARSLVSEKMVPGAGEVPNVSLSRSDTSLPWDAGGGLSVYSSGFHSSHPVPLGKLFYLLEPQCPHL